jgi:small subunit ribosomal protein S10
MLKYRIKIKSFNLKIFKYTFKYLVNLLKEKNILSKSIILPKLTKKFCVLSSPHIDKNAREQFEICFYTAFIDIKIDNLNILNFFFNINLPSGILITFHIIK